MSDSEYQMLFERDHIVIDRRGARVRLNVRPDDSAQWSWIFGKVFFPDRHFGAIRQDVAGRLQRVNRLDLLPEVDEALGFARDIVPVSPA